MNAKQRERVTKLNRDNEKAREKAKQLISEFASGGENSGDNIRAARLWANQNERCLYCGKPISAVDLFSNKVQVDHILPRAQTLDNSMSNVAVVHTKENLDKGDRTIFEWVGEQQMFEIADRAKGWKLPFATQRKILTEHVEADAIPASLLTQTGYINSLARDLVAQRPGLTDRVEVSRGRLTAALLYRLGLKKDRDDHRRHAQDAAMIALTTNRVAQQLSRRYKAERDHGQKRDEAWGSWEPWDGLRTELVAVYSQIVVSHKPDRKVSGQLHEETYYGKVSSPTRAGKHIYARRRPVDGVWTAKQLTEVADPVVAEAMKANLRKRGFDPEADKKLVFDPADPPLMPDGNLIKRARCHINFPANRILRPKTQPKTGVSLANNHIAYVYENEETGEWRLEVSTRLDSYVRRQETLKAQRDAHAKPGERFLYSVCAGDLLSLSNPSDGLAGVVIVRSLDGDGARLSIQPSSESRRSEGMVRVTANGSTSLRSLGAWKIEVTPDGQIRTSGE
jgi:CRISPR-associated endonuclease Csn1